MKFFSTLTVALLIIFQSVTFAATETFSASGEYTMSDYDTPEIAEEIALDFAKQNAAEQAGIYLESYSLSIDAKLETDEIKTVASSKVEVLTKNISRQLQADGRILLRADIKATVDTSELDNFVKQEREQRQAAIQRYRTLQAMNDKIKRDIENFQAKLAKIKNEVKDDDLLVEQERINREFLSLQKLKTVESMEFSNHFKKIEILNEAVKLNPRNGSACAQLGEEIYLQDHNLNAALQNFNRALTLEPKNAKHYMQRGEFYRLWRKDYPHAIEDFNQAIKLGGLDDEDMRGTESRLYGIYVFELHDYSAGIENFTQIINLWPQDAWGYIYRGYLYKEINETARAIKDYAKAAEVAPLNVGVHLTLGHAYEEANNNEKAIECFMAALNAVEQKFKNDPDDIQSMREYLNNLSQIPLRLIDENDSYRTRLNEFIKRYPNVGILYEYRAYGYENFGEYDLALKDFDTALKLATTIEDQKRVHNSLAHLYRYGIKDKDKVTAEYQSIIDLDPKNPAGYEDLYTWLDLFVKDEKKADEVLNRLAEIEPNNSFHHLRRAGRLSKANNYAQALEEYNLAVKLFPDKLSPYLWRAHFYGDRGEFAEAVEDITQVIKMDSKNHEHYSVRAEFYVKMEDWANAAEDYTKAIELYPYATYYYEKRAEVYEKLGEYDKGMADTNKVLAHIEKVIEFDRNSSSWYLTEERDLKHKAKMLALRAKMFMGLGEYNKALTDFNESLELHKHDNYAAEQGINSLFKEHGDKLKINDKASFEYRGDFYRNEKKYDLAVKEYTRVLESDPNNTSAYFMRADCYKELGKYDKALSDYDRLLELDPEGASYYYGYRVEIYEKLGRYEEALADINRLLELVPNESFYYAARAEIYEKLGENEKALADYNKAMEFNPNNAIIKKRQDLLNKMGITEETLVDKEALAKRAFSYLNEQKFDLAIKDCTQILEIDPNYSAAYFVRGGAYVFTGKFNEALSDLNKCIEALSDQVAEPYIFRALAYGGLGEYDKALADLDKAATIDPKNEVIEQIRQAVLGEKNKTR